MTFEEIKEQLKQMQKFDSERVKEIMQIIAEKMPEEENYGLVFGMVDGSIEKAGVAINGDKNAVDFLVDHLLLAVLHGRYLVDKD